MPIEQWRFKVDQDVVPDWYDKDPGRYEQEFREAVNDYVQGRFLFAAGYAWEAIKKDGNKTYYLMAGCLESMEFGETNDYRQSNIRKRLNDGSILLRDLKDKYGDRLSPISMNLLSLDGFDDYGAVEGDLLAIPTFDLYRECRKNITKIDNAWYLATPDSTPTGYGSDYVRYVDSRGDVCYDGCYWGRGVRPFFILES